MRVDIAIDGLPDAEADISTIVSETIRRLVFRIEQQSKVLIQTGEKTGKLYRRKAITKAASKKGLASGLKLKKGSSKRMVVGYTFHRASAAGEAPATDTGFLVNSISVRPRNLPTNLKKARVEVAAAYGEVLEFQRDRPFITPAIDWAIQQEMPQL